MRNRTEQPKIRAFAVDPTMGRFRCDGCGKHARSAWDLADVPHWGRDTTGRDAVCGTFRADA